MYGSFGVPVAANAPFSPSFAWLWAHTLLVCDPETQISLYAKCCGMLFIHLTIRSQECQKLPAKNCQIAFLQNRLENYKPRSSVGEGYSEAHTVLLHWWRCHQNMELQISQRLSKTCWLSFINWLIHLIFIINMHHLPYLKWNTVLWISYLCL